MDKAYLCSKCKTWYIRYANISCCVLHGPGQCCHYGEHQATEEEIAAVRDMSPFVFNGERLRWVVREGW